MPRDARDHVSGDLEETFGHLAERDGTARASRWYWQRTLSFASRFLVERLREQARGFTPVRVLSWMDMKLALRMLARYPGLTLVGVLGMAVGVALAAGAYSVIDTFTSDRLPLDEGDRVVTIENVNTARNAPERRLLYDFVNWRTELRSIADLGVYRQLGRNLILPNTPPETVRIAEMSASGFRVARVPPLLGRWLDDRDERADAPPVVVIDYDTWMSRFNGDAGVSGRTVQLGTGTYSIVGVMPRGFAFPVNNRLWIPLRADDAARQPLEGPEVSIFGRLAPGATLQTAQAEVAAIGRRTAALTPATHEKIRPRVLPFTYPFFDIDSPQTARLMRLVGYVMAVLLVIVSINVAILVYARTATRAGEIAVRAALGATRGRIIAQLFAEALALSVVATVAGLALTSVGLARVNAAMLEVFPQRPFWWEFHLSSGAVVYTIVLALLSAAIVGIVPALKATGRRVQHRLQGLSAGGGAGMQLGRTWTVLIVAQVAFAVALLPGVLYHSWDSVRFGTADAGFPADEFLAAQVFLDRPTVHGAAADAKAGDFAARYAQRHAELVRRLEAEPQVRAVTYSIAPLGQELAAFVEVDGLPMPSQPVNYALADGTNLAHLVRFNRLDIQAFDALDAPRLAGRGFQGADAGAQATAIVVNRTFVTQLLGGGNAIGRRVRYVGRSREASAEYVTLGTWYDIVGVVGDIPVNPMEGGLATPKIYHAAGPGTLYPMHIAVRTRGIEPAVFASRLREVAASLDPNLQLRNVSNLDDMLRHEQSMMRLVALGLAIVSLSVVVLSGAGIYALMSFTVARRRREIGIRTALGADAAAILRSIFARAATQLGLGAALGTVVALLVDAISGGELLAGNGAIVVPLVAALMTAVGLFAASGPARRGLRIHPTEALREQ